MFKEERPHYQPLIRAPRERRVKGRSPCSEREKKEATVVRKKPRRDKHGRWRHVKAGQDGLLGARRKGAPPGLEENENPGASVKVCVRLKGKGAVMTNFRP